MTRVHKMVSKDGDIELVVNPVTSTKQLAWWRARWMALSSVSSWT